jgi:hypothetical protein
MSEEALVYVERNELRELFKTKLVNAGLHVQMLVLMDRQFLLLCL